MNKLFKFIKKEIKKKTFINIKYQLNSNIVLVMMSLINIQMTEVDAKFLLKN